MDSPVGEEKTDEEQAEEGAPLEKRVPAKRAKVYKDDEELDDTIFLRNVARFDTTQESLKAHMEANWGETVYCLLCKDRETGESKGTAFVRFKDPESAGACLGDFEDRDMQQKFFLDGRNIFVLPALNRNQMGEVRRASARKEEPQEKKVKKPRWYRPPVRKDSDEQPVTGGGARVNNTKEKKNKNKNKKGDNNNHNNRSKPGQLRSKQSPKPDKRAKKNQVAGRSPGANGRGKAPAGKGSRDKQGPGKGRPQKSHAAKRAAIGSDKKMKKTKKVKRKG